MTALPARDRLSIYGASDYAVSAGKGDFTVHVIVGLDPDGALYLLDLYRAQADTATSVDAFLDMVKLWKPIGFAQEAGQINSSIGPSMRERMKQRKIFVATETFPTKGDKSVRAQAIRGRLAVSGMFVSQADWWPDVRTQSEAFRRRATTIARTPLARSARSWIACPRPVCQRPSRSRKS